MLAPFSSDLHKQKTRRYIEPTFALSGDHADETSSVTSEYPSRNQRVPIWGGCASLLRSSTEHTTTLLEFDGRLPNALQTSMSWSKINQEGV